MSRKPSTSFLVVGLIVAVVGMAMWVSGQTGGSGTVAKTTKNGDWPAYTADISGARYCPLDQINASNFNKLEVAWRFKTDNLGTRPEFKLEGTPLVVKGVALRDRPARVDRSSRSTPRPAS